MQTHSTAFEGVIQLRVRTLVRCGDTDGPAMEGYRGHGVFTYSVLRAIGEADTDRDGTIAVTELIAYLDRVVPELSDRAFKARQVPQTKFVGSNFPLLARTAVLSEDNGAQAFSESIPEKPTHVVIAPAEVFAEAGARGLAQTLDPGTLVSVIRTEQGWVLVARDGRKLGYVAVTAIAKMQ
jgi:hypothetical protein